MGQSGLSGTEQRARSIKYTRRPFSHRNIGLPVAILDLFLIVIALVGTKSAYGEFRTPPFGLVEFNAAILFVLLNVTRGLYQARALLSRRIQLKGICSGWLLASALTVPLAMLPDVPNPFSLASTMGLVVVAPALLLSARILVIEMTERSAAPGTPGVARAVLVGDAEELASFTMRDLAQYYGIEQVAAFVLRGATVQPAIVDGIVEAVRVHRAEQVLVALPWSDRGRIERLLNQLRVLPTPIVLLADSRARAIALNPHRSVGAAITIELQKAPLSRGEAALKRAFDVVVSGAILCALLPVLLLIAVAVRADSPGPVLFRQTRRGFNGAEFRIKKFRSMSVLEDGAKIVQASSNDPRVTRFGRILRRTSLDELPQLLNVLRGDMSLVGPRPHAVAHDVMFSNVVANYTSRFRGKPGITGWAQINGFRGETPQIASMQSRIDLDLWYINNWSLLLDFRIVVLTIYEVVRGRNAF